MTRYFGTDGIRGIANRELTCEIAYKIGSYLGSMYDRVVIGKDTRISSSMLESAIASGLSAYGCDAYMIGYTSTPALAYTTKYGAFDAGIMISASHNPYYDNGIKIFSQNGLKIATSIEDAIEDYIDGKTFLKKAESDHIGKILDHHSANKAYAKWLDDNFHSDTKGLKIGFDLANGGSVFTFNEYVKYLDGNISVINDKPNGTNINKDCGSTHLDGLRKYVKDNGLDLGFAFDGDADRVLAIDNDGNIVDGDKLMYILAKDLKADGKLYDDVLVTTIMSNIGLYKALKKAGIKSVKTDVGDKNVAEAMLKNGYCIGGEQSGHIIVKEDGMFGDGLKTALRIIKIITKNKRSLKELADEVTIYPQLLVNEKTEYKKKIMEDEEVIAHIKALEDKLQDEGRILVRPSGTEPLIRVMVEAKSDGLCKTYVDDILKFLKEKDYVS